MDGENYCLILVRSFVIDFYKEYIGLKFDFL